VSDETPERQVAAERSPWSRPSVLLSGSFLLALALLGVIVAVTGHGGAAQHRAPVRTPAARQPASARADTASGCGLATGQQNIPASSPPTAQWGTVGSMQVPQNPAVFGPQRSRGPWNTCFAHDPTGALLAAMNLWAEGTAVPASELFQRLAVGAPTDLGNTAELDANGPVQFAGYRYDSYTPAEAQVAVVFQGPEGKLLAVVTPMVWHAEDWKYLFPSGGTPAMEVIPDLTGYVPWSAF
jgi:hypothetical protein